MGAEDEYKPRAFSMLPNQNMKKEVEWDPFAVQYADDDLFEKAQEVSNSDEDNHIGLDHLIEEPKIEIVENKSNKGRKSNIRTSDPYSTGAFQIDNAKAETNNGLRHKIKTYATHGEKNYDPYEIKNY